MAKGISNTSRTLKYLKDQGWNAGIVERYLQYAGPFGKRIDLFGIIDLVVLTGTNIIGVQSCGQSFAEHNRKILAEPMSLKWLESGGQLMLIGWRKIKVKHGGKAMKWSPRIKWYSIKDFKSNDNSTKL